MDEREKEITVSNENKWGRKRGFSLPPVPPGIPMPPVSLPKDDGAAQNRGKKEHKRKSITKKKEKKSTGSFSSE